MQLQDLPDPWEEATTTKANLIEFIVKPTGEMSFKGIPNPEIVKELMVSSDYQRDQHRKHQTEIEKRNSQTEEQNIQAVKQVNQMTIGFIGITFLLCILCAFFQNNGKQQEQRSVITDGEFLRGTSCKEVK